MRSKWWANMDHGDRLNYLHNIGGYHNAVGPDYLTDYNAIASLERRLLVNQEDEMEFAVNLSRVVGFSIVFLTRATPRHRAEALAVTIKEKVERDASVAT